MKTRELTATLRLPGNFTAWRNLTVPQTGFKNSNKMSSFKFPVNCENFDLKFCTCMGMDEGEGSFKTCWGKCDMGEIAGNKCVFCATAEFGHFQRPSLPEFLEIDNGCPKCAAAELSCIVKCRICARLSKFQVETRNNGGGIQKKYLKRQRLTYVWGGYTLIDLRQQS